MPGQTARNDRKGNNTIKVSKLINGHYLDSMTKIKRKVLRISAIGWGNQLLRVEICLQFHDKKSDDEKQMSYG